MAGFLFRLETADGAPAEPSSAHSAGRRMAPALHHVMRWRRVDSISLAAECPMWDSSRAFL